MLTLENTQEYSKSTDRYLKVFFPGFRKALAILCQFIGRVQSVSDFWWWVRTETCSGSIDQPGVGFGFSLSCAECTGAFGARKAACP